VRDASALHSSLSERQRRALGVAEFIGQVGGWTVSALPLADHEDLRIEIRTERAAEVTKRLADLGCRLRLPPPGQETRRRADPRAYVTSRSDGKGGFLTETRPGFVQVSVYLIDMPR
jgi:hypothetical protein